jgi:hypothetical protein
MLMAHWRKVLLCSCLFAILIALGAGLVRGAAKSATEAPAGFNTPSFCPGPSQSWNWPPRLTPTTRVTGLIWAMPISLQETCKRRSRPRGTLSPFSPTTLLPK